MSYGADTDYWGFADTYTHLQGSTKSPGMTEANCEDSFGTLDTISAHDTTSEVSVRYSVCGAGNMKKLYDTASGVDFRLGKVIGGYVITGAAWGTDNKARPTLEISGQSTSVSDTAVKTKFDPALTLLKSRKAQAIGVTLDTGTKVVSSSARASVSVAKSLDSNGEEACLDVYGGVLEATNNLVSPASRPGATVVAGWVITAGVSDEQENTGYGSGSVTVKKPLVRDT
jgi:hypothetical protein